MKKLFSKLLFITILFLVFPAVSFAEVSKIVFTTDPQSVKPGILSLPITIQTQDSSNNSVQTPETLDIQFISTSPTGEFLGSTGNPATAYMSKNTANKTFYYKDSTEGNFTITINIRGRDTGVELGVSQQITVSSSAVNTVSDISNSGNLNSSGEVLGASSSEILGESTTNVSSPSAQLEILAGSDRMTSPGSPIWFQAMIKKNTILASLELNWSFGDGNVGTGSLVSHTYKYPGDYVVILSARAGDIFSVSRLKVKVFQSDIAVSDSGEYLEILNKSNNEINLFNWKIENNGKGFIFQPNTIILPKSSIKLDKSLLKMKGLDNSQGIALKNSLREEVFVVAPIKAMDLKEASKTIENLRQEVLAVQSKITNTNSNIKIKKAVEKVEISLAHSNSSGQADLSQIATSTENVIYEVPKPEGFIAKLTNFIKRVFSK